MKPIARAAGHLWAAPVTAAGLLVAFGGGARLARRHEGALDLVAPRSGPLAWFFRKAGVSAFTWGAAIVYRDEALLDDTRLCRHEREHVRQCLALGPLMAVAYPLASLWQLARGGHPYRDNVFEVRARKAER